MAHAHWRPAGRPTHSASRDHHRLGGALPRPYRPTSCSVACHSPERLGTLASPLAEIEADRAHGYRWSMPHGVSGQQRWSRRGRLWSQVVAVGQGVPANVVAAWSQLGDPIGRSDPVTGPLTSVDGGAPRGIRTPNRQIRSLVLSVDLVGSRRIWPAQVGWVVGRVGSGRVQSDRLDDQRDDQVPSDTESDGKASRPRSSNRIGRSTSSERATMR
jgi:hypothetical protein